MMRVGLLNIQNIDNYGANLIAYAMEQQVREILEERDIVETIDFRPDLRETYAEEATVKNIYLQHGVWQAIKMAVKIFESTVHKMIHAFRFPKEVRSVLKSIYRKTKAGTVHQAFIPPEKNLQTIRLEKFEYFKQQYLSRSRVCTTSDFQQMGYDAIVVGSDVVWKPQRLLTHAEGDAYFLRHCGNVRRIAYAASLGISDPAQMKRLKSRYKAAIEIFDAISIREKSGTEYIQGMLPDRQVYNCIDPVFLREETEYRAIAATDTNKEPYIYAYILGNNPGAYQYVERLAREKNLKIMHHTNNDVKFTDGASTYSDGPSEFLARIRDARYVITDSFHGTAFSIIFQKQFFSFTRGVLSVRLENFMSQIELKDRLLAHTDETTDIDREIPYNLVWEKLTPWISESKKYLQDAIWSNRS